MDNFGKGAIVIALIIEGFILWGGRNNPNENLNNILLASILPAVLILTVLIMWWLQKGET